MRGLMWFREDLRLHDNLALHHASLSCTDGIVACYVINTELWRIHDTAACRVEFELRGLQRLGESLNELNIPLIIFECNSNQELSHQIVAFMQKINAKKLFFNKQYEINESRRDELIVTHLK